MEVYCDLKTGTFEETLYRLFKAFDTDKDNTICYREWKEIWRALRKVSSTDKVQLQKYGLVRDQGKKDFANIDLNGDGSLDFQEFKTAVEKDGMCSKLVLKLATIFTN